MLKAWQERRYNRYNSEEDVEVPTSVMVRGGGLRELIVGYTPWEPTQLAWRCVRVCVCVCVCLGVLSQL